MDAFCYFFSCVVLFGRQRRVYSVPHPNFLWHGDSHLKLFRWRFVTFGVVDGFTRAIVGCRCAVDNTAQSALGVFLSGIAQFGTPIHYRCDHGLENHHICLCMASKHGPASHPVFLGPSTHNVRIERFWRDLMRAVLREFYNLFFFMEASAILNPFSPRDLYALHFVFLPIINSRIESFRDDYNHHPLSTEHRKIPLKLYCREFFNNTIPAAAARTDIDIDPESFGVEFDVELVAEAERREREEAAINAVPPQQCPLDSAQLEILSSQIDPLAHSTNCGMDIYLRCRECITALLG
jgi:hypothetical protein